MESSSTSGSVRRAGVVVVLVAIAAVVIATAVLFLRDYRVDLTPDHFLPLGSEGGGIDLLDGAREVTDEVCTADVPCRSAWGNESMTLMKFDDRDSAASVARALGGEAYRSDWLVARFADSVDPDERRYACEALDGTWQSEVD